MPTPRVSVLIPCRNEIPCIESCLRTVLEQEAPSGGFEVIVADGESDDGTREVLDRIAAVSPTIRVVENPARIQAAGLNAAIRAARGEIIIRMDAHTIYASDYIRQCVSVMNEHGADNVGGPWVAKGNCLMSDAIAAAFQSPFATGGARGHDPGYEGEVDTVYLGCWRREVFQKFGEFDEEFTRNEDDEFNLRLTRAGGKVWQSPKIRCWYRPRRTLSSLFKQYTQYGYWKVRVIQKHKIPASCRHLVPGFFVLIFSLLVLIAIFNFVFSASVVDFCRSTSGIALLAVLFAYVTCVLAASVYVASRTQWKVLPPLPFVFPCYHFGYGYGFLRGIWDFMISRKGANHSFQVLTR